MILYDHKKSYQIYLYVLPRIILYMHIYEDRDNFQRNVFI